MTANESSHEVGVDDLFFSTTDRRGVIRQANGLFVEFSRHPRERVIGAPHNVIRNPRMPGGVFTTMWRALERERPFAGYVHNTAADGSRYSVFATVTPLPEGYLSVRIRPGCEDRFAAVDRAYAEIAEHEAERVAGGASRREAAESGAELLGRLLAEEGYADYERFQWDVLPGEMTRHHELGSGFPERPDAAGRLGAALSRMQELDAELGVWLGEQERLGGLARGLRRAARRLQHELDRAETTAAGIASLGADAAGMGPVLEPLRLWTQMQGIVRGYIVELIGVLGELERHSAETRFRVALAQLHTNMMSRFLAELHDGGPESAASVPAIGTLATALRIAMDDMRRSTALHRELTTRTAAAIDRARGVIEIPRRLLVAWLEETPAATLSNRAADVARRVAEAASSAGLALDELARTTERCAELGEPHDPSRLAELLARIERAVERVARTPVDEPPVTAA